ncbi:Hypothetical predicted protein [Pelobates cultripes]|uniref:Trichohyalin-plectin-homology domain-containing protein n=1 Tax=Pelobates cultripes TaxID=61616 RepID=A0AAD1WE53_PELCU|nr:Hypothetical predicted protein [Pelobates cultripes]
MATASAPVVQYGRRKGMFRAQSAEEHSENKRIDLRQITVLPKSEWERILNNTNPFENEARQVFEDKKEREEMHLRSKELTKNWKNTISDLKHKPLQIRKQRKEKEEEEKRIIDLEEAQFQAEQRKEAIEKAKIQLFYENDRIKTFHSALLLTEVMKEREAQIELKTKMMNMSSKQGSNYLEQTQRDLEQSIMKDQAKAREQTIAAMNTTSELLKQIEEHKRQSELEKIAMQREGVEIERLTRLHNFEMNKLAKMKMDQKKQIMAEHLAHVANRNYLRQLELLKEKENEDKIQRFLLAKKKMDNLKKERQNEIVRKTLERRDQISKHLAQQIKQKEDNEDERIEKAVAQRDAKSKWETDKKEEKIRADIKAITEHRIAMKKKQEMEEKEQKLNALQALHAIKEADNLFLAQKRENQRRAEEDEKMTQTAQIQQIAEKMTNSQLEKEAEVNYAKKTNILLSKEEENFQEYAKQVIDSVSKAGRNPYPLVKAAQKGTGGGRGPVFSGRGGIRPSYLVQDTSGVQLPAYKKDSTQQIKEIYDSGDIQKGKTKLGFTW